MGTDDFWRNAVRCLVVLKRVMVARYEVHFAVKNLLNLCEDFVSLLELLLLIVGFVVLVAVGSVTSDQDDVEGDFGLSVPFVQFLYVRKA